MSEQRDATLCEKARIAIAAGPELLSPTHPDAIKYGKKRETARDFAERVALLAVAAPTEGLEDCEPYMREPYRSALSETPLFQNAKIGAQLEEDGSVTPAMPAELGPLVNALRPVVSEIFDQFGSLSRGQALQRLVDAARSVSMRSAIAPSNAPDEDGERYRWFRDECDQNRRIEILEVAGEYPEMLDHHIDKGRCGL